MAFKLTKDESKRRDGYAKELRKLAGKLEDALGLYNQAVQEARNALADDVLAYNEKLQEARGFAEDIVSRIDDEFGEKSDKWQEGEKAEAVTSWKDEWEAVELEDIELDEPEELSFGDIDHADNLDALSVAPEGSY